jgi:CelD/BcsL family acetyltransferase involved in cellulose biosynthesis
MDLNGLELKIFDAAVPEERQAWLRVWESWPQREVFAHPGYVTLYSDEGASRACCAVLESSGASVLYPFLMRDISVEEYWEPSIGPVVDLTSAYGYGGPYVWGDELGGIADAFWSRFEAWALQERVISEFVRFALYPATLPGYSGVKEERLQNVVRRLDLPADDLWMDFKQKVRKNVKKAQRSGVVVHRDASGERLEDFLRIYESTMDRRDASRQYYFPRSYFERLQEELTGHFMYFHAVAEDRVISTELVLVSAENVYSFLGGTDREMFALRPNDLLKYEIMLWARQQEKKRFVLGGGYQENDGIYQYKLAFAPDGAVPYFVGCRVFDQDAYTALLRKKRGGDDDSGSVDNLSRGGYFPAYRA